ncbi:uncharacterized protein C57A7.06 [Magnolia sinica]|uniref:uncharacterized protein C57A7.06 n=1 Tax=Magnolia sinica TaxID=86752 RepID=UPI002658A52E|nr:uncharacterized protein C57A7.06 [Magnolia sinica]
MAEERTKSKLKDGQSKKRKNHRFSKTLTLDSRKKTKTSKYDHGNSRRRKQTGPLLPSALQKELGILNPNTRDLVPGEEEANNLYEYDEPVPQEESSKNRRFDPVDNLEYELPHKFKDENVPSDDDVVGAGEGKDAQDSSDESEIEAGADEDDNDNDRHIRMLKGITGMSGEAFEGKKKKEVVLSEAYQESEYNLTRKAPEGDGHISIQDLLEPLHGKAGYNKLRKRMHQLERKSISIQAPLPKSDREKLERKAAYKQSSKDITKWEPLVKRNREAPTVYFDEDVDLGYSTVGAIASEFEPRTEFEKKMASLVCDAKVMEAHAQDGARLLELNKISIEDVRDRQNRLAKMRSLLFRHELKAKHIKKIKSKTFHRLLKKDRLKAASAELEMDPEAAKENAMKQEFKRAEERMTLKHKNSSKWAKRILKRGLKAQDEGTRAAISEQLHQHSLLTRKVNSMKDNSSSDDSSDEDEDDESSDNEVPSKLLTRAKEKTLKVMEEEDEMPKTGVLSLPFMVRGLQKRMDTAYEEAQFALEEYDSSLKHLEDGNGEESPKVGTPSGRRVFGVAKKQSQEVSNRTKSDNVSKNSDSEDDSDARENDDSGHEQNVTLQEGLVNPGLFLEESDIGHETLFKSFDDITRDPGPKTLYEVAIFASDSWKKIKSEKVDDGNNKKSSTVVEPGSSKQDLKGVDQSSDSESDEEMVEGILSTDAMAEYELPSQADLIHSAFAGDDVEGEFEKDKSEILNEENPEPEKPVLLPGWGQWTHIQQKKGLPSWMVEEHENAKKKRDDALKKRKDANLKHVIISEKIDKKAEKLHTKTLPFPFTSKEVFEQSIRMPIGPEFNPMTSAAALNRPAVVKKPGVIIKPIQFEEVNPHEKMDEPKQSGQVVKMKKRKVIGGKAVKKTKREKNS